MTSVAYYGRIIKGCVINALQLINSLKEQSPLPSDVEQAFMYVSRKDSMDELFKTLAEVTPYAKPILCKDNVVHIHTHKQTNKQISLC